MLDALKEKERKLLMELEELEQQARKFVAIPIIAKDVVEAPIPVHNGDEMKKVYDRRKAIDQELKQIQEEKQRLLN